MASGATARLALPYPLETDSPDVAADVESLANSLDHVAITGQGVLSSRPAAAAAGKQYMVQGDSTPGNNGILWWDTGSAWVPVSASVLTPIAKSTVYTANYGDDVLATGTFTVTLPSPSANQRVGVKNVSTGTITVSTAATIIGLGVAASATSILLGAKGSFVVLVSDGTNWFIEAGQQDSGYKAIASFTGTNISASSTLEYRLCGNVLMLGYNIVTTGACTSPLSPNLPAGYIPAQSWVLQGVNYAGSSVAAAAMEVTGSSGAHTILAPAASTYAFTNTIFID